MLMIVIFIKSSIPSMPRKIIKLMERTATEFADLNDTLKVDKINTNEKKLEKEVKGLKFKVEGLELANNLLAANNKQSVS